MNQELIPAGPDGLSHGVWTAPLRYTHLTRQGDAMDVEYVGYGEHGHYLIHIHELPQCNVIGCVCHKHAAKGGE